MTVLKKIILVSSGSMYIVQSYITSLYQSKIFSSWKYLVRNCTIKLSQCLLTIWAWFCFNTGRFWILQKHGYTQNSNLEVWMT